MSLKLRRKCLPICLEPDDHAQHVARYGAAKSQILAIRLQDGPSVHVLASLAAGTVATTVCAPADVLKSRLQNSSSLTGKRSVSLKKEKKERDGEDTAADEVSGGLESSARVFAGRGP